VISSGCTASEKLKTLVKSAGDCTLGELEDKNTGIFCSGFTTKHSKHSLQASVKTIFDFPKDVETLSGEACMSASETNAMQECANEDSNADLERVVEEIYCYFLLLDQPLPKWEKILKLQQSLHLEGNFTCLKILEVKLEIRNILDK